MRRILPSLLLLAACAGPHSALRASALSGKQVDISAEDLEGRMVRLADVPARVRVVDLWASWCEPCRAQLPVLDQLAQRYGDRGLSVTGVSFDEDRAQLEAFLAGTPVGFQVLWDKGGARLAARLDVQRLPTTLVLDRRGVVRLVRLGYTPEEAAALEREVVRLLAEPEAEPGVAGR